MKFLFVTTLIFLICETFGYSWTNIGSSGDDPLPKANFGIAQSESVGYLFGGGINDFTTNPEYFDNFYSVVADPHTGDLIWTEIGQSGSEWPTEREFMGMAASEDYVVVCGGSSGSGYTSINNKEDVCYLFDLSSGLWTEITAPGFGPGPRTGPTVFIKGDNIYVFGGISTYFQPLDDFWKYNIKSQTWSLINAANGPSARYITSSFLRGNTLVVYGGESLTPSFEFALLDDTYYFDLNLETWSQSSSSEYPAQNYNAYSNAGNNAWIYGGDVPGGIQGCGSPFPQGITSDVWRLKINQDRWEKIEVEGGKAIKRLGSFIFEVRGKEYFYRIGGFEFDCDINGNGQGQIYVQDYQRFSI